MKKLLKCLFNFEHRLFSCKSPNYLTYYRRNSLKPHKIALSTSYFMLQLKPKSTCLFCAQVPTVQQHFFISSGTTDAIITYLFTKTINIVLYQTATRNASSSDIKLHVFSGRVIIIIFSNRTELEIPWKSKSYIFEAKSPKPHFSVYNIFLINFVHRFYWRI